MNCIKCDQEIDRSKIKELEHTFNYSEYNCLCGIRLYINGIFDENISITGWSMTINNYFLSSYSYWDKDLKEILVRPNNSYEILFHIPHIEPKLLNEKRLNTILLLK